MDWDHRLSALGVGIEPADYTQEHRRIKAAFITVDGNWDDVPDFARQYQQDTLGGATHAFGRLLDRDGNVEPEAGFGLVWPGGSDSRTPEPNGWANMLITAGYDWSKDLGPYSWLTHGNADKLVGIGLPYPPLPWQPVSRAGVGGGVTITAYAEFLQPSQLAMWRIDNLNTLDLGPLGGVHVSFFAVWQTCDAEQPEPPEPPPDDEALEVLYDIRSILAGLAAHFGVPVLTTDPSLGEAPYTLGVLRGLLAEARKQEPSKDWEAELMGWDALSDEAWQLTPATDVPCATETVP